MKRLQPGILQVENCVPVINRQHNELFIPQTHLIKIKEELAETGLVNLLAEVPLEYDLDLLRLPALMSIHRKVHT